MLAKLLLSLLFFLQISTLVAKETLIFAIDIIRHGDRTPLHKLENTTYPWQEGLGQLTVRGMEQQVALGSKLRKRYIEVEKLLPYQYQHDTVYVRSTDYDRTLMSAYAFLLGLYPPGTGPLLKGLQPIPIHSQSKAHDELIPNEVQEQTFNELLEKHVYSSKAWQNKTANTKKKWPRWRKITGWKINNLRDLIKLGNILYIYQLYHAPLPPELTQQDIQEIIAISEWGVAAMYRPKEIGATLGAGQLKLIAEYLEAASKHQNPLKYVLLSAHDSSILSLLSALGAPLTTIPPYASHLSFALYENEAKEHTVFVRFNDKLIEIPSCLHGKCSLDEFTFLRGSSAEVIYH